MERMSKKMLTHTNWHLQKVFFLIKILIVEHNNPNEEIEIRFLGMKFKCRNPTGKAIILVFMLLMFFVALVVLSKLSLIRLLSG